MHLLLVREAGEAAIVVRRGARPVCLVLEQQGLTPEPVREECRFDASEEIRRAISADA
jgi:hypothetical protein